MNKMNFLRAAQKAGLAGCAVGWASELHIKAGYGKARWTVLCAVRRPGPLSYVQPSEIQVYHLETRPSGLPTFQLVLSHFYSNCVIPQDRMFD